MTEISVKMPGEYKKEVDSKWKKYEKNKNRLLKKIEGYSLLDDGYKEKVRREILENFLGKEKEEKEGKEYLNAIELLEIVKQKYKELEQKRENLRHLEEERGEIEKKIDEYEVNIVDVTTIDRQGVKLDDLDEKVNDIELKVAEAKKDVEEMEEEIKAMEESYGKMEDVEIDEADTIEVENEEVVGDGLEKGLIEREDKKVTLKEYRKKTLSDLREKDRVKREIIALLNEGVGIDDKLRDRVKEEVMSKYDEYSKEKTESIEMKSANLLENRLKDRKERYEKIKSMIEGEEKKKAWEALEKEEKAYGVESLVEIERKREKEKEKTREILKPYREQWIKMLHDNPEGKEIIKAADKIPVKVVEEPDGSRLIEFVLGGEEYKILDVNLKSHSEWGYLYKPPYGGRGKRAEVALGGMTGKHPSYWTNKKLGKYVKQKQEEGFKMPHKEEIENLLEKLQTEAKLQSRYDAALMLGYLTGMYGDYWLDSLESRGRNQLHIGVRIFDSCGDTETVASLFLLSVKNVEKEGEKWQSEDEMLDYFKNKLKRRAQELALIKEQMKEMKLDGKSISGLEHQLEILDNLAERKKSLEKEMIEIMKEICDKQDEAVLEMGNGKKSEVGEISEEELKENEKMDGQGGNNGSAEERNVDTGLTQEVKETEDTGDTLRKIRENLIIEWYEKKLNRDELLRVLGGIETIDKEKRKKVEEEIIKEFYENYGKAKEETEGYGEAEEMYRGKGEKKGIKKVRRELIGKEKEVKMKKEETKGEIEEIEGEQLDMALKVADLRDKSTGWWKRMGLEKKLRDIDEKREELRGREDKINKEIGELEEYKKELEKRLKEQEKEYGGKIARGERSNRAKKGYRGVEMEEVKKEGTLKGYKEKYEKMVKDKEEYMKEFMKRLKEMEIGVSAERKKEVMEMVEKGLNEEIARLKEGDETMKKAEEVEKWLEENWEVKMAELSELEKKMEEKMKELNDAEENRIKNGNISLKGKLDEKRQLLEIGREFAELKSKRDEIKGECDGKYESYYGVSSELESEKKEDVTENVLKTSDEKREDLILEWYEKKLNRDELLRILGEEVMMDKESKERLKKEIIKDFYENYEKAKDKEWYKIADTKYRKERTKRQLDEEILELETAKGELNLLSKGKGEKNGKKVVRSVRKPERLERKISKKQEGFELSGQTTLKGYKERYEQVIKDREEYNEKLLGIVRDLDIGISEEKKKEVLENIELTMKKEIEELKEGDETMKIADEIEKWLKKNMKKKMEELSELEKKMEEMKNELYDIQDRKVLERMSTEERLLNEERRFEIGKELEELKSIRDVTKGELDEKCRIYYGVSSEELVKKGGVNH